MGIRSGGHLSVSGVEIQVLHVSRDDGSEITAYGLFSAEVPGLRPTVVLLHGSGAASVFPRSDGGGTASPLLFGSLLEMRAEWDVLLVEKRGVHFGDGEPERGAEGATEAYRQGEHYEGRVADVLRVLEEVSSAGGVPSPCVVIGSSEGSGIAVGVGARSQVPSHIALLPFSAGHGLLDSLLELRAELSRGEITPQGFQEQYDWLVDTFGDVLGPLRHSTDRFLWGHSYRRWSSYCSGETMADLFDLDIPVFLGIPSLDPCVGADTVVAEFLKRGKTNLTYQNYVNYDHGFFEHANGRAECRHDEVLNDILTWVQPVQGLGP